MSEIVEKKEQAPVLTNGANEKEIKEAINSKRMVPGSIMSFQDLKDLGALMAASGWFKDGGKNLTPGQACTKILAGAEMGIPPFTSLTNVFIVKGNPCLSANLQAGALKKAGYKYKVIEHTEQKCRLLFIDPDGDELGHSEFTIEEAQKVGIANKDNWKYTKLMLFKRAVSHGVSMYAPEVFGGMRVYDESEAEEIKASESLEPSDAAIEINNALDSLSESESNEAG